MANFIRLPTISKCIHCLRESASSDCLRLASPLQRQLRGKKKLARGPDTIKVKLQEDIKGYGRNGVSKSPLFSIPSFMCILGSIIPVAPGRMRNIWYPQHKASYVTESQLKELGDKVTERDVLFGTEEEVAQREKQEEMVEVQMKLLPACIKLPSNRFND